MPRAGSHPPDSESRTPPVGERGRRRRHPAKGRHEDLHPRPVRASSALKGRLVPALARGVEHAGRDDAAATSSLSSSRPPDDALLGSYGYPSTRGRGRASYPHGSSVQEKKSLHGGAAPFCRHRRTGALDPELGRAWSRSTTGGSAGSAFSVPYHMIGAEQHGVGNSGTRGAHPKIHPGAPVPPVFLAESLFRTPTAPVSAWVTGAFFEA